MDVKAKTETTRLAMRYQEGKRSLDTLLERHGGLAVYWAKRYRRQEQCCELEDLTQEARRGLMDAAGHFDPDRGAFTTCASLWIKKRCLAFIEKARQFGAQLDKPDERIEEPFQPRDMERLQSEFHVVYELYRDGRIRESDFILMKAIASPQEQQDEILKPMFAEWWKQARRKVLNRIAIQIDELKRRQQRRQRRRERQQVAI